MNNRYDIVFIGHVCIDEIIPYKGATEVNVGSAVLCGAMAAVGAGASTAIVTRIARNDYELLDTFKQNGIDTYISDADETTYMKVEYPSENVDVRHIYQLNNAGYFEISDIPQLNTRLMHLAGITDQEFRLDLIKELRKRDCQLSTDMQSFVRKVDPNKRQIDFCDVDIKKEIVASMDRVKLDIVEAQILTKYNEPEDAAKEIEGWGCPEIVITSSKGLFVRSGCENYFEPFTNKNNSGRTGRGDTTFAAFLAYRLDHDVAESVRFAAALVSLKMESPGPFTGKIDDVNRLIEKEYCTII
jgi:sugar/nucleoside kinase (ribokinase family)